MTPDGKTLNLEVLSLQLEPCTFEKGSDESHSLPHATQGQMEFQVQLLQVKASQVAQLDFLQVLPQPFHRVKERAGNNFLISSWRFGAGLQTPPSPGP